MAFLGLDVGGTRCRYEWWPLGEHAGGDAVGVQPVVHGVDTAIERLAVVLREAAAVTPPAAVVAALAGAGDVTTAVALRDGLAAAGIDFPVTVVGDVLAAAAAALRDGPGVLVCSGTGSFAVARDAAGHLERVGGRGYLLGDQGGGYDLVRRAAAAVLMAVDGLGPATDLTEALTLAVGASTPERIGARLQELDTAGVARHVPVVVAAAACGDAVAAEVLEQGAESLAMLANAAARSAGLELRGLRVSLGGGVLRNVPALTERLAQRLDSLGVVSTALLDDRAAAIGAAWLAHGASAGLEPQAAWVRRVAL